MIAAVQLAAGSGCTIDSVTAKVVGLCTAKGSITLAGRVTPSIMPLLVLGGGALVILLAAAVMPKRRYPGLWAALTFLIGTGTAVDGLVQWTPSTPSRVSARDPRRPDLLRPLQRLLRHLVRVRHRYRGGHLGQLPGAGKPRRAGTVHLHAAVLGRSRADGASGRFHKPFPRPGDPVHLAVHDVGLPQPPGGLGGSRPQVLHPGLVHLGDLHLRGRPHLRGHRLDAVLRDFSFLTGAGGNVLVHSGVLLAGWAW